MYQDVDRMSARMARRRAAAISALPQSDDIRCGGCGAKVGPGPLSRVLRRLGHSVDTDVVIGLDAADDAAVIAVPKDTHLVQTVDFFPAFIDDPYVLGEIAANHALNDIYAMGGTPRHALATVVVPAGPAPKVEEELYQVLAGARAALDREGTALVGGHSSEGADLSVGFSVSGHVSRDQIIRKGGLRTGDALVLTGPLGTGILFAAAMRAKADASSVEEALLQMRRSSRQAAEILIASGTSAMTDVSGFGLAGHLGEMLTASTASARIDLSSLPLYKGIIALARAGIASSLLSENLALIGSIDGELDAPSRTILFDPQTAGGLLAGVPPDRAEACVAALREAGYSRAGVVGEVTECVSSRREVRVATCGSFAG
jgi:selenide,water dikinase